MPDLATTTPAGFGEVRDAVAARVAMYDGVVPGLIALVRVGEESEVLTGGLAEVDADRPTAPGMTFPIASITKPMTAALVLQLADEGRLALDDRASRWLPELRGPAAAITVEQLLGHRGGLAEVDLDRVEQVGWDPAALLELSVGDGPAFAPGDRGVYSNEGYAALGLLVERVLGRPLAEAFEQRVFEPAGMRTASLGGRPDVQGYTDGRPVRDYLLEYAPAAGSVVASAGDVDAFFRALWGGELVPPDAVEDMRTSRGQVRVDRFWQTDYGLGLMRETVTCGTMLGHTGGIIGFTLQAWTLEDGSRSTVVAVNDNGAADVIRSVVEGALCGGG